MSKEPHQIPVEDFDLMAEWMALEPEAFRQQISELRNHPRITSQATRKALEITIQALEALHQKR